MTEAIRLMLVDDQELVRTGFRFVLDAQADMTVVAEAGTGRAALDAVAAGARPDLVLMDVRMPTMNGIEATERLLAAHPEVKVLVLTTFDLDEYCFAALRAGASGFLLKDAGPTELLAAIRAVHSGDAVVAPSATKRLLERFVPSLPTNPAQQPVSVLDTLTEREREVLIAVGQGLNNAEIASTFFLAEATVKSHIGHILAKLHLRDRVQMVVLAYDTGLVRPQGRPPVA